MHTRDSLAAAAELLAQSEGSLAWLDAGPSAASGSSYLIVPAAREHRLTANVRTGLVVERGDSEAESAELSWTGDIFTALRDRWQPSAGTDDTAQFSGGWVGWIGYECATDSLHIPMASSSAEYPDAAWFRAGAWARLDHATDTLRVEGTDATARERLTKALSSAAPSAAASPGMDRPLHAAWRDRPERYAEQVRAAQALIADGEAYQLCLTSQVSGHEPLDAFAVYRDLRAAAPSHHGSFIRVGDTALASASPEQFLELTPSGRLSSKPIKGTRRRGTDPHEDEALAHELQQSEKERAENVMIVDLMRNDLGRLAVTGSVSVPSLLQVESYAPVHQLVSTIRAQIDPAVHPIDAVRAAFPAGSMTGAPKHRAVTRLQELESGPRGIYSGAHGYLSDDGSLDLAMTIRTIVMRPDGWAIGAGGGITSLSIPDDEVAEAQLKARALLTVIRAENRD
ncbi:MAG: anthranilate synthase component I family protein [Agromyces sp.]